MINKTPSDTAHPQGEMRPALKLAEALDKLEVLIKQNHDRASKFTPHLWEGDQCLVKEAREALATLCAPDEDRAALSVAHLQGEEGLDMKTQALAEAVAIAEAERTHWIKEATKHKRPGGYRSDHEQHDLERARIAQRIAEKIKALSNQGKPSS
jgi:hypothetical protein